MGIEIVDWKHDPKGNSTGGYDIYMKPRDMAVLGYMYLNGGMINNTQIVTEGWINESLTPTWTSNGIQWGPLTDYNYGYLWWLGKINGHNMFMAMGMGGQFIINFPDLDLTVVTTTNKDITQKLIKKILDTKRMLGYDHEKRLVDHMSSQLIAGFGQILEAEEKKTKQ